MGAWLVPSGTSLGAAVASATGKTQVLAQSAADVKKNICLLVTMSLNYLKMVPLPPSVWELSASSSSSIKRLRIK